MPTHFHVQKAVNAVSCRVMEQQTAEQTGKKRPWFRFHLSTAIVGMFVTGLVLWANVHSHYIYRPNIVREMGWPLTFKSVQVEFTTRPYSEINNPDFGVTYYSSAMVFDSLVSLLIVVFVMCLFEWLSRR